MRPFFKGQSKYLAIAGGLPVDRLELSLGRKHKAALMVGVAEKYVQIRKRLKRGKRLSRADNVLILVGGRAMNKLETIHGQRAGGKGAKILKVLGVEHHASPEGADLGPGIEVFRVGNSTAGFVVISANHEGDRKSTRLNSSHSSISYAV